MATANATKKALEEIGRRVFELRRARGWTQEELAERLRVDARTLQRIEAGMNITLPTVIRMAEVLAVPLTAFFEPPTSRGPSRPGRPQRAPTDDREPMLANPVTAPGAKARRRRSKRRMAT